MKRIVLPVAAVAVLVAALTASSAAADRSLLLQTNARLIRVGDWRVDRDPTLQGAVDAFGKPSACREFDRLPGSVVRWGAPGVRVTTTTYGGIPEGFTFCSYGGMPVSYIVVTARVWTTSLGLRVGDSVAKLRRLYPHARYQTRSYGESSPGNSYVLVTTRTACLGECGDTRVVTVARLIAKMHEGRVGQFVFPVGAQGE